ncbi:MAG: hypothetical protein L0J53_07335, partial [Psychrobacter sp.]|nr:hypothetical protein [Psychrobacter sp.]
MQTTSAQAAGQYYNCANANGCKLVDSKFFTSRYTQTKYPVVMAHGLFGFTRACPQFNRYFSKWVKN